MSKPLRKTLARLEARLKSHAQVLANKPSDFQPPLTPAQIKTYHKPGSMKK